MKDRCVRYITVLISILLLLPSIALSGGIPWDRIRGYELVAFYPGFSSWEFLTGDDHRLGARSIKKNRKRCIKCHLSKTNELDLQAERIVSGRLRMKRSRKPFEIDPIPGKKGVIRADLRIAYDSEYLYMRIEWESRGTSMRHSGDTIPDRVSMQVNKSMTVFKKYGCFITCHDDQSTMPKTPPEDEVRGHPYYSGLGRKDVRLYAFYTRRSGGWSAFKDEEELRGLIAKGGLIDLWTVELKNGKTIPKDGYIFKDRLWDERNDIEAVGEWKDGRYSVVLKRRLVTNDPEDVVLREGEVFSLGIAIHDNRAEKRRHYVSFPVIVGLGVDGDIRAERIKNGP